MYPCIRCQHCITDLRNVMNSKCGHPDLQTINVVTGDKEPLFCTTARIRGNKCGPEGELWAYDDAFPLVQEWEQ